jgi:hypothetical protein
VLCGACFDTQVCAPNNAGVLACCTPIDPCSGTTCGTAVDNCGQQHLCGCAQQSNICCATLNNICTLPCNCATPN